MVVQDSECSLTRQMVRINSPIHFWMELGRQWNPEQCTKKEVTLDDIHRWMEHCCQWNKEWHFIRKRQQYNCSSIPPHWSQKNRLSSFSRENYKAFTLSNSFFSDGLQANINKHGQGILNPELVGWHTRKQLAQKKRWMKRNYMNVTFAYFNHWDINLFGIFSHCLDCKIQCKVSAVLWECFILSKSASRHFIGESGSLFFRSVSFSRDFD